ncbi:hypothetical protein COCCADRAFT_87682 [Bipolaris zeicola 26-R-13]|uniref:Uncharacterized protein n=1 Tax=Cochliobolus carbonum (strain 26-R-13) TaxID=930089 RepID=W6YLS7_COCC2|nr:uncharacterized protein COCCADRAFT_87682 [Bipolaris zeicola 26-R-13]EUC36639.1 hypothetical protein COCCADRAFT_87682 [Bipolaris zeicola 26-R-13]
MEGKHIICCVLFQFYRVTGIEFFLGGKLERRLKFRLEARVFFPFVCLSSALKD